MCKSGVCSLRKFYTCAHLCEHHSWARGNPAFPAPSGLCSRIPAMECSDSSHRSSGLPRAAPGPRRELSQALPCSSFSGSPVCECTGPGGAVLSHNSLVMCPSHHPAAKTFWLFPVWNYYEQDCDEHHRTCFIHINPRRVPGL